MFIKVGERLGGVHLVSFLCFTFRNGELKVAKSVALLMQISRCHIKKKLFLFIVNFLSTLSNITLWESKLSYMLLFPTVLDDKVWAPCDCIIYFLPLINFIVIIYRKQRHQFIFTEKADMLILVLYFKQIMPERCYILRLEHH